MDILTKPILALLLLLLVPIFGYAQGCSDAGFCSIDAFRPKQPKEQVIRDQIRIGTFYGNADHAIAVYGISIAYGDAWSSS